MEQKYRHFTLEDRIVIAGLQAQGRSIRQIAAALDRAPSSISRELKRNCAAQSYKPVFADQQGRARRWTGSKLERDDALRELVLAALSGGLSPEQIAGRMLLERHRCRVSHETIYRFIYAQMARHNDSSWRNFLPQAKSRPSPGQVQARPLQALDHWHRGTHQTPCFHRKTASLHQRPKAARPLGNRPHAVQ